MRIVIGTRLFLGHRDLVDDLVLLNALPDHLLLQVFPEIVERQPFLFQRRLELRFVLELVLRANIVEHLLELRVAKRVAQLLPALDDEHLVHRFDQRNRRDLVERFPKLYVVWIVLEIDPLPLRFAQPRDLPVFEIGLREDLAIDLDEDLLDDFGPRNRAGAEDAEKKEGGPNRPGGVEMCFHC